MHFEKSTHTQHCQRKAKRSIMCLTSVWSHVTCIIVACTVRVTSQNISVKTEECKLSVHIQHIRPSGFFCCWSDGLKLTTRRHAGSGVFYGQLQTVTEDIFIFTVLVCSAHYRFVTRMRYINLLLTLTLTLQIHQTCCTTSSTLRRQVLL